MRCQRKNAPIDLIGARAVDASFKKDAIHIFLESNKHLRDQNEINLCAFFTVRFGSRLCFFRPEDSKKAIHFKYNHVVDDVDSGDWDNFIRTKN